MRSEDNIFIQNSTADQATLRRWYQKGNYSEYKCAICGQEPWWNGQPLVLTLDHINGDNHDDRLENLRWVCPNCDRQLPTFAGKNICFDNTKKPHNYCVDCGKEIGLNASRCLDCSHKRTRIVERPTKEELFQILVEHNGNFSQVGKMFDITDNAVRKWCKQYNLPSHSKDYKNKQ